MSAPLHELRVVDLTQGDGAPFAAMQLGDAGADVIKVEPLDGDWARALGPPFDHGDGPLFMAMNRNKRSIALDIERADGRQIVQRLAQQADVLVESFPGAGDAARLALDYEALSTDNPGLVYCDLSLLERSGPLADKPATDLIVQGIAGLTRFVGERGKEPVRFGTNYAGVTASLYAVQAILAALYWRRKTGLGQQVATSYLRGLIATQQNYLTSFSEPDAITPGFATMHLDRPARGMRTQDRRIEFGLSGAHAAGGAERLFEHFGLTEQVKQLAGGDGNMRALLGREDVRALIEAEFIQHRSDELLQALDELGFMCAPVHDYDSMFHDEGVLQQEVLLEVEHPVRGTVRTTGLPWTLPNTPGSVRLAPPVLGQHTEEILRELAFSAGEIAQLRGDGVVR